MSEMSRDELRQWAEGVAHDAHVGGGLGRESSAVLRLLSDHDALAKQLADVSSIRLSQWCKEERDAGNGGCGACAICCKEWRDKAEHAEARLTALTARHERVWDWLRGFDAGGYSQWEIADKVLDLLAEPVPASGGEAPTWTGIYSNPGPESYKTPAAPTPASDEPRGCYNCAHIDKGHNEQPCVGCNRCGESTLPFLWERNPVPASDECANPEVTLQAAEIVRLRDRLDRHDNLLESYQRGAEAQAQRIYDLELAASGWRERVQTLEEDSGCHMAAIVRLEQVVGLTSESNPAELLPNVLSQLNGMEECSAALRERVERLERRYEVMERQHNRRINHEDTQQFPVIYDRLDDLERRIGGDGAPVPSHIAQWAQRRMDEKRQGTYAQSIITDVLLCLLADLHARRGQAASGGEGGARARRVAGIHPVPLLRPSDHRPDGALHRWRQARC